MTKIIPMAVCGALLAFVSLTAVAQEAAIELRVLSLRVSVLEQGQAALAMRVSALEAGQAEIRRGQAGMRKEMITQRDLNNAIARLIAAIQEKKDE